MGAPVKLRTVHGGARSALKVELFPVKRCTVTGAAPCPDRAEAEGWAVYLRNPHALLVRAEWPSVDPHGGAPAVNKARSMSLARSRAALFADALGDHLGAPVIEGGA
jgi:hypothetical protein